MDGEQKFWAIFNVCAAVVLCTIAISIAAYNYFSYVRLIENGYQQQMVPGSSFPIWVKSPSESNP